MHSYEELLNELNLQAEPAYAAFHKRLLKNDNINVLGVRVPTLRKIAKNCVGCLPDLLGFPDDYYEVTFVKLQAVACLPWEEFIKYVDRCVPLIDNWATCDCFTPRCVVKHKEEFLPKLYGYLNSDKEFFQRFALTMLLHYYVEEEYLNDIFTFSCGANTQYYYVHMAVAWLIAEVIVKFYAEGTEFIKSGALDGRTHNKAIQKARESFRLTAQQKEYLKTLKR